MQSKTKPPVPPKPSSHQLNQNSSGASLTRNKNPPPTLPKPQRPLILQENSQDQRLEECAHSAVDVVEESVKASNGESGLLVVEEDWEEESEDGQTIAAVRRTRSSPINRNKFNRRTVKRVYNDYQEQSQLPLRLPKSSSTSSSPPTLPRRTKPKSCPSGDSLENNDEFVDFRVETQAEPVSSEEEPSSESSSDEEKSGIICSSGRPRKCFLIAKELMTSERTFVDVLKLLAKDLHDCVDSRNKEFGQPVIPDDIFKKIFGCFPQLHALNQVLLSEVEHRIEHWEENPKISDIIMKHGPFLKLYTTYIKNYSNLIANLDDACKKFPLFNDTLKDFETEKCKKLEVRHFMLKPIQRIPQYRLLLTDYLKQLDKSASDYKETEEALNIVSEVAEHANETMKDTERFAKLLQIQNNLFGGHQVVKPGRSFIREGDLAKQCRKGIRMRRFILFNDCLLHCSATSQGLFKVHHELPLSDMKVETPKKIESHTEFCVLSVARSFTLAASTVEEKQEWLEAINNAISLNEAKRSTFLQAKLHNQNGGVVLSASDERLGQKAPVWIPDSRVTMCQVCMREFTLTFRRHHCRACGKVVCSLCSANRAPLFYLNYQPARVCYECFKILQNDISAQDKLSVTESKVKQDLDVIEDEDCENSAPPSIENLRAQFKKLTPIVGDPKKVYVPKVLQEVSAKDSGSTINGYLYKKVKRSWKRQWFVVKDRVLYSYKASEDVAALDSTPLLGYTLRIFEKPIDGISHLLLFELYHSDQLSMLFYAESEKIAERWIEILSSAVILE